jgi:hypothetical protein
MGNRMGITVQVGVECANMIGIVVQLGVEYGE